MRLGGPVFETCANQDEWIAALRRLGYRAAYCPVADSAADDVLRAYAAAAQAADIVIAEVGAWSNPLSPDEGIRREAIALCQRRLDQADRIGARCCVNITGSRGEQWDGPHPDNLTAETFDMIVETVREIIDAVKPVRAFYTLETMPWMYPDSPQSYADLIRAIDRKQCAAHLDPVNLICSPQRYYGNADLLRECFRLFGEHIKSCHAKDILLRGNLTTHLDEVRIGLGGLDYRVYLQELDKLAPDVPLMLEHLPTSQDYDLAAAQVRAVAQGIGVRL
ncbi:MAG: sugar phosphate isomerase/epimerase [Chloroflexi bacterium]|nr:sugar phosphate isomerase/epimerase [Chloroflexota bacterium]MCL5274789.1 sugar phosphate isomerase/epimerase [Chloroflexota bacterium]